MANKKPSQKTVKWYNDLKGMGYSKSLPKDFAPKTQKEYGLGLNIMLDAQYKATNGKYGQPRKSTINKEKKELESSLKQDYLQQQADIDSGYTDLKNEFNEKMKKFSGNDAELDLEMDQLTPKLNAAKYVSRELMNNKKGVDSKKRGK